MLIYRPSLVSYMKLSYGIILLLHLSFVFQGLVAHWHYLHSAVHSWRPCSLCEISRRFYLNKHFTDVVSAHLPLDQTHTFEFDTKAFQCK